MSLSSTCTTVIQLPGGDRAQQWAAPVLTRQSAGKFQTGLCEQAYACNKFHYFGRRESETTCRSKNGTVKRSVTRSLDHWYEQVHTLTIAEAGAQALVISDLVKMRIDGSRGHPSPTIRKCNLTPKSPCLVAIRITYMLSRFALWNLEATVHAMPTMYKVSNLESCLRFPSRSLKVQAVHRICKNTILSRRQLYITIQHSH